MVGGAGGGMAGKEASITAMLGREPERVMGKRGHWGTGAAAVGTAAAAGASCGADGGHGKVGAGTGGADEWEGMAVTGAAAL